MEVEKIPDEVDERKEGEVQWVEELCPDCGDRMFFDPTWERNLCRSWLYMEGGCKTW